MSNEQKLRNIYRKHELATTGLVFSDFQRIAKDITEALATTEPEPTGMPEVKPWDHPEPQTMRWSDLEIRWIQSYGEQCWKAGYKHGAWGTDKKDAERYRWLADSNNYYEAINLISDGSLTEDALGKAIDAAMANGVKG